MRPKIKTTALQVLIYPKAKPSPSNLRKNKYRIRDKSAPA